MKPGNLQRYARVIVALLMVATAASVWMRAKDSEHRRVQNSELYAATPSASNEYGYVSSDRCMACHPGEHQSWHDSFHRTMTQVATPETVLGDFNVSLPYFGKTFNLHREGDGFYIGEKRGRARVVQTTGSHHYQMYWINNDGALTNFPFVYLLDDKKWVRRNDVFLHSGFNQPEGTRVWNNSCIKCHSTHGQPKMDVKSAQVSTTVGELGIACEACHGPADEHIQKYSNPLTRYVDHVQGADDPRIMNPAKLDSHKSSQVCGQCHGITRPRDNDEWNNCGFTFRPGQELLDSRVLARHPKNDMAPENKEIPAEFFDQYFWNDGMVRVSGREFNGLVETPCYKNGELSCLSCHSMHDSDPEDQLSHDAHGNSACLQCHSEMGDDISAHTHHAADSSGSSCYNCHMPHTTYGLVKAIRSHTIDSPSAQSSVDTGRPNACNACHLDKTLEWTSQQLTDWYGHEPAELNEQQQSVSAALLWLLKGDAGQRALAAWHFGWQPALDISGNDWQAPFVSELLQDPYPVVRSIAGRSLRKLPGYEDFAYDYSDVASVEAKATEASTLWPPTINVRPNCLLDSNGGVQKSALQEILRQRDNRLMDLLE